METPAEYNSGKQKEETKLIYIKQFRPYKVKLGYTLEKSRNMTRENAINRMAKALCLCDDDSGCKGKCDKKCAVWKYSIPHAEAALNALLGE